MTSTSRVDEAAFYRAALLLGLVRGEDVVRWADDAIGREGTAPPALMEISITDPGDLTVLRQRLFEISGEGESAGVVRRLFGLAHAQLSSGRRSFADTMTVLKQLRAFLKLDRDLNEHLKSLGVDVALGRDGAEQRVRDWLRQHE
jgi:hypothetical protein